MMILYLFIGLVVFGIGLATIFVVAKQEESIFRAIPGGVFVALGIVTILASLTLSGRVTEKASVVVATTTDGNGVRLTLADGAEIACEEAQGACRGAQVGNLVTYQIQRHESGLWAAKKQVTFVTRGPGQ